MCSLYPLPFYSTPAVLDLTLILACFYIFRSLYYSSHAPIYFNLLSVWYFTFLPLHICLILECLPLHLKPLCIETFNLCSYLLEWHCIKKVLLFNVQVLWDFQSLFANHPFSFSIHPSVLPSSFLLISHSLCPLTNPVSPSRSDSRCQCLSSLLCSLEANITNRPLSLASQTFISPLYLTWSYFLCCSDAKARNRPKLKLGYGGYTTETLEEEANAINKICNVEKQMTPVSCFSWPEVKNKTRDMTD